MPGNSTFSSPLLFSQAPWGGRLRKGRGRTARGPFQVGPGQSRIETFSFFTIACVGASGVVGNNKCSNGSVGFVGMNGGRVRYGRSAFVSKRTRAGRFERRNHLSIFYFSAPGGRRASLPLSILLSLGPFYSRETEGTKREGGGRRYVGGPLTNYPVEKTGEERYWQYCINRC